MKHFYKTLIRQIFILLMYTLIVNIKVTFFYIPKEKGMLNPLLFIPFYTILHIIILIVYTTSNHQEDRKKLKNYLLVTPIIFILSIAFTVISLYLNH